MKCKESGIPKKEERRGENQGKERGRKYKQGLDSMQEELGMLTCLRPNSNQGKVLGQRTPRTQTEHGIPYSSHEGKCTPKEMPS